MRAMPSIHDVHASILCDVLPKKLRIVRERSCREKRKIHGPRFSSKPRLHVSALNPMEQPCMCP